MALQALCVVEHRAVPLERAEVVADSLAEAAGRDYSLVALCPMQYLAEGGDSANHVIPNFGFPIITALKL